MDESAGHHTAPYAYRPDVQLLLALPWYATHPVKNIGEHLCSNDFRPRFRALALQTAVRDSALFTLLVASGIIGDQRLEHYGEPRGKSFGPDALGGNAGALA
jgi:hypothetical protein